ncbi:uncharacterized protein N7458_007677 [Penicillium daleae]|uniref:Major facilitator superfamily (MFS) profile domain-containing protein n=1 Tax=Penicillium daleae TaxID=63821 RepID=A0AAD6C1J2_9EURO|nr:uncharacterized protein N7458_007677 [Penicillium daleae]KAJ5443805.1 hypothetical protein N7458_007677 [Penicillium daleae]
MIHTFGGLTGERLNTAIAFFAGCSFFLFGYDMGYMGSVLTQKSFIETMPSTATNPNIQGITVGIFEIGCLLGALSLLEIGDRLGRRKTVLLGQALILVGGLLQASAFGLPQFLVGRVVAGVGLGLEVATVPPWQSECAKPKSRGYFVMLEGALCSFGVMTSFWVGYAFLKGVGDEYQVSWRMIVGIQCIIAAVVFVGVFFLPESPRWLLKHGYKEDAYLILGALLDLPSSSEEVEEAAQLILTSIEAQKGDQPFRYKELFTNDRNQNFRRMMLGIFVQGAQQISGINVCNTYVIVILTKQLGLSAEKAQLLAGANGTQYFLFTFLAILFIERVGRRKMLMFAATGQGACFFMLPFLLRSPSKAAQAVAIACIFLFNTFFGLAWVGIPFLYNAEVTPLRIRAPANAIGTASNWIFCFITLMIAPVGFKNIHYWLYMVFAIINLSFVPITYFFVPETAGRSLEDMDLFFAKAHHERRSPVAVAREFKDVHADVHQARIVLGLDDIGTKTPSSSNEMSEGTGNAAVSTAEHGEVA